jgi:hypothetical protein
MSASARRSRTRRSRRRLGRGLNSGACREGLQLSSNFLVASYRKKYQVMRLLRLITHRPRKAQPMRDRDSKREADRERRARIKAGTWDFPNGGAAEFAKAGAAIRTSSERPRRSPKSPDLLTKPEVSTPARAPRPVASAPARSNAPAPRVITPTPASVISPAPARAPSTSSGPPSMVAMVECPVVA